MIPEIKELRDRVAPHTLLTINGDIPDRQTGLQLAEQYGVDPLPASSKSMSVDSEGQVNSEIA